MDAYSNATNKPDVISRSAVFLAIYAKQTNLRMTLHCKNYIGAIGNKTSYNKKAVNISKNKAPI